MNKCDHKWKALEAEICVLKPKYSSLRNTKTIYSKRPTVTLTQQLRLYPGKGPEWYEAARLVVEKMNGEI